MKFANSTFSWIAALFALAILTLSFVWRRIDFVPPDFPTPLTWLFAGLLATLLVVALRPIVGRLRNVARNKLLRFTCPGALVPLLMLFWSAALPAEAQQIRLRAWTNMPAGYITTLATSNLNNNPFTLQPNRGVGVMLRFTNQGPASCTNLVVNFEISPDGSATNWSTLTPAFRLTCLGTNGTSPVLWWSNLISGDIARLNNAFQIRPSSVTNLGTGNVFITHAWWTYNSD